LKELYILKTGKLPEKDLMLLSIAEMEEKERLFTHIDNLSLKDLHLQLSSFSFDKVTVQMVSTEGLEYLPLLVTRAKELRVFVDAEDVSSRVVSVLSTIYPDKAPALRKAFMQRKRLTEVLYD